MYYIGRTGKLYAARCGVITPVPFTVAVALCCHPGTAAVPPLRAAQHAATAGTLRIMPSSSSSPARLPLVSADPRVSASPPPPSFTHSGPWQYVRIATSHTFSVLLHSNYKYITITLPIGIQSRQQNNFVWNTSLCLAPIRQLSAYTRCPHLLTLSKNIAKHIEGAPERLMSGPIE